MKKKNCKEADCLSSFKCRTWSSLLLQVEYGRVSGGPDESNLPSHPIDPLILIVRTPVTPERRPVRRGELLSDACFRSAACTSLDLASVPVHVTGACVSTERGGDGSDQVIPYTRSRQRAGLSEQPFSGPLLRHVSFRRPVAPHSSAATGSSAVPGPCPFPDSSAGDRPVRQRD